MKYPANFVTALPTFGIRDRLDWATDGSNDSVAYVAQIEAMLAEAAASYSAQRYSSAIASYKSAQAQIYRLLHPHEWGSKMVLEDRVMLPLGAEIEEEIAKRGLELVAGMKPQFKRSAPPVLPAPDTGRPLTKAGFVVDPSILMAGLDVAHGITLLEAGRAADAVEALEAARPAAAVGDNPLGATVSLNLSSAQIAAGEEREAAVSADRSIASFRRLGDEAGAAQALHNKAIALTRLGDDAGAHEAFAAAAQLVAPTAAGSAGAESVLDGLQPVRDQDSTLLAIRRLGDDGGPAVIPLEPMMADWSIEMPTAVGVTELKWTDGRPPLASTVLSAIGKRRRVSELADLILLPVGPPETATYLSHLYGFVIPQALGDCYRGLGNHERAEQYYVGATKYSNLNEELEAPGLWVRIAENALEWGDRLYKQERLEECRAVYGRVVGADGKAPEASVLYATPSLGMPAAVAREVIAHLSDQATPANPAIALPVITVWQRWQHLLAELDFWGTPPSPIFTFEYLQQVARGFAEQAIHAEREYVSFQSQAEAELATRRELEGAAALADAEVDARGALYTAAKDDTAATVDAVALAQLRVTQAEDSKKEYETAGYYQYITQSMATAVGAHEDWYESEIRKLASDIEAGSAEGNPAKLAAAATLLGGQKSYEYQLARMDDHIEEAKATGKLAEDQAKAARSREEAARLSVEAARMRSALTHDAVVAFENEVFTPELWSRMAQTMRQISASYQEWAIRSARTMQNAYNFESDADLRVIKNEYPAEATGGVLGSDDLLRDIESFTWQQIAHTRSKETQLKDVISLVNDLPFSFYELQRTGRTSFGTMLSDFERAHPGFYAQRIHAVEVELVGLLPPGGPRGTLRAGGTSRYRTADGGDKARVHGIDTLALSDYDIRQDGFLFRSEPRIHGLFEGHGLATTWELTLPKRSNDLDFRMLSDIRLVIYYSAQFSPELRDATLSREPLPGELVHVRNFLARYDFPEAWYSFLGDGTLRFRLEESDLPRNETSFSVERLAITVAGADGVDVEDVGIEVTPPGKPRASMKTDAEGSVSSSDTNPLHGATGGDLLGEWEVKVTPPTGSDLLDDEGKLRSEALRNLAFVLEYGFAWPE
jgi:hypothetical protein